MSLSQPGWRLPRCCGFASMARLHAGGLLLCMAGLLCMSRPAEAQELTRAQQYFEQGYAYHTGDGAERDLGRALSLYKEALKHDPKMFEAHSNLARVYYAQEKYRYARDYFRRGIDIARSRGDVPAGTVARDCSDLGGCYYQEGRLEDAEQWFRFAIQQDPTFVGAHYNLINALMKHGHLAEARQAIAVAEKLAPSPRYGIFKGRLASQEGEYGLNSPWLWLTLAVLAGALIGVSAYFRAKTP